MNFSEAYDKLQFKADLIPDLDTVPTGIANFLTSEGVTSIVFQIGAKYGMNPEMQSGVLTLVVWYVSKLINEQQFVNLLFLAGVQEKFFDAFKQELQDKLWEPYDAALADAKIPYKMLTKLNPESAEKIEEYVNNEVAQYEAQQNPQKAAKKTQEVKDFSLGDQIKVFAAQQPTTQQPIRVPVADTSFVPEQKKDETRPVQITVTPATTTPQPAPKPATEQPAQQVRIEVAQTQAAPPTPEIPETQEPAPKPFEPVFPSVRFEPLLQKQEGGIAKEITPSGILKEALREELPHAPIQPPAPAKTPEAVIPRSVEIKPEEIVPQAAPTPKPVMPQATQPLSAPQPALQQTVHEEKKKDVIDLSTWSIQK